MPTAGDYLSLIAWLYIGAAVVAVVLVLRFARGVLWKLTLSVGTLALFAYWPITGMLQGRREDTEAMAKHDVAKALFDARCKGAGEKIIRTVENVDGVVWMKWRDKLDVNDDYDQFKLSDPYGRDCHAEECIEQLLRATKGLDLDPNKKEPFHSGYRFAESVDPATNQLNRYTRQLYRPHDREPKYTESLVRAELIPQPMAQRTARYGITWDDISTREDREHWVAGGSLKVIDLQTNEVIAERVGYMMDRGQGSRAGFRTPWLFALQDACPEFTRIGPTDMRRIRTYRESPDFLLRVLQPSKAE